MFIMLYIYSGLAVPEEPKCAQTVYLLGTVVQHRGVCNPGNRHVAQKKNLQTCR